MRPSASACQCRAGKSEPSIVLSMRGNLGGMTAIRHPAVAGTFYPAEPDVLERQLALFLSEAGNVASPAIPKVIIGPHAGYAWSGAVAARAYARLAAAPRRIRRVGLLGPATSGAV